jgi:hypothetical protein
MQRGFCGLLTKPFSFGLFCRALSSAGLPKALVKNYFEILPVLTAAKGGLA